MSAHFTESAGGTDLADNEYPHGKGTAYYVLGLLTLLYVFDFIDRVVVSSLFSSLNADLGITKAQFGYLMAIVNVSIAILAFPASLLVDRWSRKKMVGLMAVLWGLACLACAFAGTFSHLLLLRFIVGAGEAGYGPGASSILQSIFPPNKRNSALGMLQAGGPFGVVVGMLAGGYIAEMYGWRHAFGIVAIPGIFVALLIFFIKEPVRATLTKVNKETGTEEKVSVLQIVTKIFKTRTLVLIFIAMAMSLIFNACVGTWVPSFFVYTKMIGPMEASHYSALVMVAGALGAFLGGMFADRCAKKNPRAPLLLSAFYMIMCFVCFTLAFRVLPLEYRVMGMMVGYFFLSGSLGPAYNAVLQASHRAIRATSLGCLIVVQNILGMAIGAGISGKVAEYFSGQFKTTEMYTLFGQIDQVIVTLNGKFKLSLANYGQQAFGISNAFITMATTTLVAAAFFYIASRFYQSDCKGAECFE